MGAEEFSILLGKQLSPHSKSLTVVEISEDVSGMSKDVKDEQSLLVLVSVALQDDVRKARSDY